MTTQQEDGRPAPTELDDAFDRTVNEGEQRLQRSWRETVTTGFVGGTEVALGVLALVAVRAATGSPLLAGLAFSVGFIALLLARSELFTEGFLIPITALAAKRASWSQLLKLWSGTLVTNLLGGWLMMWLIVGGFPDLRHQLVQSATHYVHAGLTVQSLCLSVLGGAAITLMTRMQHGTDAMVGKIVAAVAGAFLLAGLELFHSILDSLLIFGAIDTGDATFGYLDWLAWFVPTVVGNVTGGLVLVTLLRLVRSKERLDRERREASARD